MNFPNLLTILRVILTFFVIALLSLDFKYSASIAFVVFFIAGITDWVDGYWARKYNEITTFGKFMDALSDKILVMGMWMALFAVGIFENFAMFALWCCVLALARELFVSGIRMLASSKNIVLAAENLGKWKAGFQMYSIGALMCSFALSLDFGLNGSALYMLSFYSGIMTLFISTVLSLLSGFGYIKRYGYLLKD